jgi:hypothetical protein
VSVATRRLTREVAEQLLRSTFQPSGTVAVASVEEEAVVGCGKSLVARSELRISALVIAKQQFISPGPRADSESNVVEQALSRGLGSRARNDEPSPRAGSS